MHVLVIQKTYICRGKRVSWETRVVGNALSAPSLLPWSQLSSYMDLSNFVLIYMVLHMNRSGAGNRVYPSRPVLARITVFARTTTYIYGSE